MTRKTPTSAPDDITASSETPDQSKADLEQIGSAMARLLPELHRMAVQILASERGGHTLQPTALVNELYLRLRSSSLTDWNGRTHFLSVAANSMRRILVDYARARLAARRGGKEPKVPLEFVEVGVPCSCEELLVVEEALSRLEEVDQRAARITELRFFVGLQEKEIAAELGVAEITVKRDWKFARAWLASYLKLCGSPESLSADNQNPS